MYIYHCFGIYIITVVLTCISLMVGKYLQKHFPKDPMETCLMEQEMTEDMRLAVTTD